MEVECVAVLIQNSCYCGGGLLLAPQASMTDGLLDVVVIEKTGRAELMFNFPRIYKGKHLNHPKFNVYQSKTVKIESAAKIDKMFDGDIFGKTPVRAKIAESSVRMVVL
jgi:diacylglycerol kinase family enzyme